MEVASPIPCSPPSSPKLPSSASNSPFKRPRGHSASSPRPSLLARRSSKPDFYGSIFNLSSHGTSVTPPLSRASSALSLLYGAQNQQHSPGEAPPSPGPHASPSISMSTATATGTIRAPRKTPSAALPFVPLTPIMASPRLTPGVAAIAGERPRSSLAFEEGVYSSEDGGSQSHTTSGESQANDYLTCGGSTSASFAVPIPVSMATSRVMGDAHLSLPPTWTSTPPTPPLKQSFEMCPSRSASRSSKKGRSKSRSHSRARAATLAALTGARHSSSPSRARLLPSSSSLASATTVTEITPPLRGRHPKQLALMVDGDKEKRRMSLPPSLSRLESVESVKGTAASSPSHAGRVAPGPLRAVRSGLSIRRQNSRKLFHLGDTEGSDGEGDGAEEGTSAPVRLIRRLSRRSSWSSRSSREMPVGDMTEREPRMALDLERPPVLVASSLSQVPQSIPLSSLETEDEGWKEKEGARTAVMSEAEGERLRAATRKYHALMELLATEAGYLMDLRALVSVRVPLVSSPGLLLPSAVPVFPIRAISCPFARLHMVCGRVAFISAPVLAECPSANHAVARRSIWSSFQLCPQRRRRLPLHRRSPSRHLDWPEAYLPHAHHSSSPIHPLQRRSVRIMVPPTFLRPQQTRTSGVKRAANGIRTERSTRRSLSARAARRRIRRGETVESTGTRPKRSMRRVVLTMQKRE